jgi:uncharacterized protein YndB with AHSA1/START domain
MVATIDLTVHEKKEDSMGGSFERTFVVSVPVERAWKAMTDPEELNKWYFPMSMAEDGSMQTEILGEERRTEVVAFEPLRMFHTRTTLTGQEGFGIRPGAREMVCVFESLETGTRITITQSGFGEGADAEIDIANTALGMNETIADLILYLETGVAFPRHHHGERSYHGFTAQQTPAGLQVRSVQADTFAAKLGLQPGDILVELGGASVFGFAELQFFTKEHAAGEQASAAWVRDGRLMRGTAELGPRIPVTHAA